MYVRRRRYHVKSILAFHVLRIRDSHWSKYFRHARIHSCGHPPVIHARVPKYVQERVAITEANASASRKCLPWARA